MDGSTKSLAINRCPHGVFSVTIDGDGSGVRITPSKCCGRWDLVKSWPLSKREWDEIVNEIQCETDA